MSPRTIFSPRNIFLVGGILLVVILVQIYDTYVPDSSFNPLTYRRAVLSSRTHKDSVLRHAPTSPIPDTLRPLFTKLDFYPVEPAYRVQAHYTPIAKPRTITQADGYQMQEAGWLDFALYGDSLRLKAYRQPDGPVLEAFVPFADATTGHTTYGGGRLMDINLREGETLVLDFNYAYNPFCVYNPGYLCPLPPPENRLPVPIEAGEQAYRGPTPY